MAAIGMMIGGAVINALAFTGGNYLFSMLGSKSGEAEKEHKRHDLAIEQLQQAEFEYQHKRRLRLDYLNNSFGMRSIARWYSKMLMLRCASIGSRLAATRRSSLKYQTLV